MWGRKESEIDFSGLVKTATLHYTFRNKPWSTLECTLDDAWWHYYRMSPVFDNQFYFKRQYNQIEAYRNDYHNKPARILIINLLGRVKKSVLKLLGK
jgi:lipopolysaccharide biosynthesis glycosyltransferase